MVQLKKKVTLKTKIADSDVKQDIQSKGTASQEPVKILMAVINVIFGYFLV